MEPNTVKVRCTLLVGAFIILAGCVQVDVVDRSDAKSSALIPERALAHNLSATGIVFEPPLDEVGRSVIRQGVDLFVEVENSGLHDESDVVVQVTLEVEGQSVPLAQRQALIHEIASDETQRAYFRLTELVDLYSHYVLHVMTVPCVGETFHGDNQRTFDLYLRPMP